MGVVWSVKITIRPYRDLLCELAFRRFGQLRIPIPGSEFRVLSSVVFHKATLVRVFLFGVFLNFCVNAKLAKHADTVVKFLRTAPKTQEVTAI